MSRPWIDLLRDGARRADLADGYDFGVSRALGASALGARNAGYTRAGWEAEVLDPRSRLGHQARLDRRHKPRTQRALARILTQAWDRAETQWEKSPTWTADTARTAAEGRARTTRDLAANPNAELSDTHRAVLAYAADRADATGSTRVNLPQAATGQALGLTPRQVRRALDTLGARHLLVCRERGRPSGPASTTPPKSSAYDLPDAEAAAAYLCRVPRQVRPNALTGAPPTAQRFTPNALIGAPPNLGLRAGEDVEDVLAAPMTRAERAAVLELLAKVRANRTKDCSIPRGHEPHDYGPIAPGGGLAFYCPGWSR